MVLLNGKIDRSLLEIARCMLLDAYIEKKFWGEAVCTANYLQNRLPTKATERTLYELRFRKRPDVSHLHIFGCEAYVHIHKEQRRKLDDKAEKFIFVGYSEESKAYRLLNTETNRVKSSRDVIFLDGIREKGKKSSKILHDEVTISRAESQNGDNQESVQEDITEEELSIENNVEDSFCSANETDIEYQYNIRNEGVNQMQCRRSERTNRGVPPDRYMAASLKVIKIEDSEPRNIKEALSGLYKDKWKNAIEEEIKSLKENGTWDIVPKPKDRSGHRHLQMGLQIKAEHRGKRRKIQGSTGRTWVLTEIRNRLRRSLCTCCEANDPKDLFSHRRSQGYVGQALRCEDGISQWEFDGDDIYGPTRRLCYTRINNKKIIKRIMSAN